RRRALRSRRELPGDRAPPRSDGLPLGARAPDRAGRRARRHDAEPAHVGLREPVSPPRVDGAGAARARRARPPRRARARRARLGARRRVRARARRAGPPHPSSRPAEPPPVRARVRRAPGVSPPRPPGAAPPAAGAGSGAGRAGGLLGARRRARSGARPRPPRARRRLTPREVRLSGTAALGPLALRLFTTRASSWSVPRALNVLADGRKGAPSFHRVC